MATAFSHPAVAIALWSAKKFYSMDKVEPYTPLPDKVKRYTPLIIGMLLTVIPDLDVIGFYMGIPYDSLFGHRGFSHSVIFALITSSLATWSISRQPAIRIQRIWLYFFLCAVSHGFVDAFTNGGHGIAFFAPFSETRYFFQYQPIAVSPLSLERFLSARGIAVIKSEFLWVWVPCFFIFILRKYTDRRD